MKKLFGILGTLAGAGLAGLGVYSLCKKGKEDDLVVDDRESEEYEDDDNDSDEE